MHVLMLNYSDWGGGAAIAARRLQRGLRARGVDAHLLVRRRTRKDDAEFSSAPRMTGFVHRARFVLDKMPLLLYRRHDGTPFSSQWLPDRMAHEAMLRGPDLIHVHWIGHGYMHPSTLTRLKRPVVWTLHDVWPFTGGCHVNLGCSRFQARCGACPRLGSNRQEDLSHAAWRRKWKAWHSEHMTLVAPSTWMANCAGESTIFRESRIEVIRNGLDVNQFKPADRQAARAGLDLPSEKKLVLFAVASGMHLLHKGSDLLEAALGCLQSAGSIAQDVELVIAGPVSSEQSVRSPFRTISVGSLSGDASMAMLYSAVDVTVVPSRQENLPQVAMESLACGTPVVAFHTTGLPEVVDHQQNGYLAEPFDPAALAYGIQWVLQDADRYWLLCAAARSKAVRSYDVEVQARHYHRLYDELLSAPSANTA